MSDTPPRRALLSAFDKTGMVELGRALVEQGWELVSSGGTAKVLAEAGLPVIPTEAVTGFPEMLGHRVVTLHPAIHGGILADRDDPSHQEDMATHGITPIDLVAVNLYPFSSDPSIELIDIGGPAMVRAAAKNHHHVTVLVEPADYEPTLAEMSASGDGRPSLQTRRRLARDAFAHTAAYDRAIVAWFDSDAGADGHGDSGADTRVDGAGDSGTGAEAGAAVGAVTARPAPAHGRPPAHAPLPPPPPARGHRAGGRRAPACPGLPPPSGATTSTPSCRPRSISSLPGPRCCATGRTRTSTAPATRSAATPAGTAPCSTAARR